MSSEFFNFKFVGIIDIPKELFPSDKESVLKAVLGQPVLPCCPNCKAFMELKHARIYDMGSDITLFCPFCGTIVEGKTNRVTFNVDKGEISLESFQIEVIKRYRKGGLFEWKKETK